jgi:2'-5' RNA ligase
MRFLASAACERASWHEVFLALYPPSEAVDQIARLTDQLFQADVLRGRRAPRERLHITLARLGGYPDLPWRRIIQAREALANLQRPSFVLVLDRIMGFKNGAGQRPCVLTGDDGLVGVFMLRDAVGEALTKAGLSLGHKRGALPHLTLSREAELTPEAFIDPVSWRAQEFCLVDSPQGEGRHNILDRWPLAERTRSASLASRTGEDSSRELKIP